MRGTLDFDPDARDYGPASREIRAVIREYAAIDWFEPGGDLRRAAEAFREHERLAGFPHAELQLVEGTRDDFADFCATVRNPDRRWDWRMSVLKQLSHQHGQAHGWRLADQTGDLFVRVGSSTLWRSVGPTLHLDFDGNWYRGYANADQLDAIQWWLAEPAATANPFVPLVRCYSLGVYPFSLARDKVVLFAFRYTARRLPAARLVR